MDIQKLECQACGATLEYIPGTPVLTCSHCGAKYHTEGGCNVTQVMGTDGIIFYAWIPQGWSYGAEQDVQWCSKQEPIAFDLMASGNNASLLFYPRAYFREGNGTSYGLNPLTMQNSHQFLDIEQYVPQRLREVFPNSTIKSVQFLDSEPFASIGQQFLPQASQHIKDAKIQAGIYTFEIMINGAEYRGYFGTILAHHDDGTSEQVEQVVEQPVQSAPSEDKGVKMDFGFFMRGGIIGAKMRGENVNIPGFNSFNGLMGQGKGGLFKGSIIKPYWCRERDVILLTPNSQIELYRDIFTMFACSVQYGPGYYAAQQREIELTNQIMMQGAMQRQQNQIAASQRLSNTISQRSNMVMDSWEKRQAAQTRMSNNFSEAIRGVNSYTTNTGQTVEASVRYDHVYQNGSDYIASDANLNLGPNWDELKKNR